VAVFESPVADYLLKFAADVGYRTVLAGTTRWIGVMGSPRHAPPHVEALRALGVTDAEIGRVHRPIGLNIGSKAPAEIAIATLAGLLADRNGRPGGFDF
jgi:xanthine dehydrogenase accessory factor